MEIGEAFHALFNIFVFKWGDQTTDPSHESFYSCLYMFFLH